MHPYDPVGPLPSCTHDHISTATPPPDMARAVHHKHQRDAIRKPLHVVTCVFNPVRYNSRWDLYEDFGQYVYDSGGTLTTIEATLGERESAIRATKYGQHISIAVDHLQEIWLKENLLNVALRYLPADWKYVAFIDADVKFARADWVDATIHALQHYHVVQMFSEAHDLGPKHELIMSHKGFAWCWANRHMMDVSSADVALGAYTKPAKAPGMPNYWHPGFAWAWRREALNAVGGLMEHGILGAGDAHMARGLIGRGVEETHPAIHEGYKRQVSYWQRRAVEHLKYNFGFIDGALTHAWHGKKADRKYWDRWKILVDHEYNPETDLKKDVNGVIRLTDTKPMLRDEIRYYFRQRNEDSIDL